MTRRFVIEAGPLETRTALIEDGSAVEFHVFPQGRPFLAGEIRLGRVASVEKAMGALFVDIGLDRPAFLKLKDAGRPVPAQGAAIVVEIIREPTGTKAARVTTRLAATVDPAGQSPPARLLAAPHPAVRLARAAAAAGPLDVIIEGNGVVGLRGALKDLNAQGHQGMRSLFSAAGIEEAFLAALDRRVALEGGGSLTIDETEALTAIDIDGAILGARAANEAGARAAAAEIRRRNLAGQIVIDFIGDSVDIAAGRHALAKALVHDPLRPELARGDLNGLILLTRTRLGPSLRGSVTEPCPASDGRRLTAGHLAARLLRRAESLARHYPGRALLARAPQDVLDFAAARFEELVRPLGAPLRIETSLGDGRDVEVSLAP
jgi:Ribonuclease G/E